MISRIKSNKSYVYESIKLLSICIIIIGIFLRFANLEDQVFNWDEVRSFYRLSGYLREELIDELFTGNIVTVQDIQFYQKPSSEKGWIDTIYALSNSPEHPPLFYLMARFWINIFPSPYYVRILAVIIGIITLPFLYWLCLELFTIPLLGWVAVAFFSISPYQILLSQAARQYSLWTLLTIISSLALLKTLRKGKKANWMIYGVSITLGLYSHLFFAVTFLSQGIYVLIRERFHFSKNILAYIITSLISLLCFMPWIIIIFTHYQKLKNVTSWATNAQSNFKKIILGNIKNVGNIFIDLFETRRFEIYLAIFIFILLLSSIYLICQNTPKNVWLFLLFLMLPSWLIQFVPDLIFQEGIRSLQHRYLVPSYLGVQISISFLISKGIETQKQLVRFGAISVFIFLILLGLMSGNYIAFSRDWDYLHLKGTPISQNLKIAPIINQSQKPLVISESTHSFIISLSYMIDNHVKFQLLKEYDKNQWKNKLDIEKNNQQFSDIFLYYADVTFLNFLEDKYPNFQQEKLNNGLMLITKKLD